MSENIQQRSHEWHEQRRGKFTSSKISSLMAVKGLGKGADTYCFELACDIVMGLDPDSDFESYDMKRGNDVEPYAFASFAEEIAKDFITVKMCSFIPLNANTGGSPDGLTSDNGVLEIKAPKRNKFLRLVYENSIAEIEDEHMNQMQHQMWVAGAEKAYYYNAYIHNGILLGHKIIVPRMEERITIISERINQAIPIRDMYVEKLLKNANFNI